MGTFLLVVFCIILSPFILKFLAMNIFIAGQEQAEGQVGCASLILLAIVIAVLVAIFK